MTRALVFSTFLFFCIGSVHADTVVWSGNVNSDGLPTTPVPLVLRETYQIKASRYINLGKWIQAGQKLANDACFEFNTQAGKEKIECLRNSNDISVCDGTYHPDHIYKSEPFKATQNRIFFWVNDTDYEDNSGFFHVEITHINGK